MIKDMDPVPPEDQTWTLWTWMAYWATDTINLGTWETASSIIAVGLTWREAIPIMVVGTTCVAIPMVLNGAIGAALHVPFSVIVRSGFGYYFAYFCIVSRSILAMFWLGIQGANGAQAMTIMISSIWPSYNNIKDTIGIETQGISTEGMISYFLFWIIQLPLLLIPPTRLRWLFIVKLIAAPVTAIATLGWCVHKAGTSGDLFHQKPTVSGSEYAYLWLSCMSAVTGSWATLACNIPDFSRYARSSKGQYIQLPFLPIIFTVCGVLGIVTTSATKVIWGEFYWNPLDIIAHWQEYGHGGRAAAFFAATSWYIAQVGTNITANSISAANDLTVLFPRWVNIFRGCIIAAIVGGWVIVPWKILSSAETFLDFMGGYAVFLAPIAGKSLTLYAPQPTSNSDHRHHRLRLLARQAPPNRRPGPLRPLRPLPLLVRHQLARPRRLPHRRLSEPAWSCAQHQPDGNTHHPRRHQPLHVRLVVRICQQYHGVHDSAQDFPE
jgi:nucleobase:cation symporter-1, NCS1 family